MAQSFSYTDPTVIESLAGEKQSFVPEPVSVNDAGISESDSHTISSAVTRRAHASKAVPPEVQAWNEFRRICDDLVGELQVVNDYFDGDILAETGSGVVLEIESLLEKLYSCPWGNEEYLKRVVVAIQSQVNNVRWTRSHVAFLNEVIRMLRVRHIIAEDVVGEVKESIRLHGLDIFRGTVSEPMDVVRKYRIVETPVGESEDDATK